MISCINILIDCDPGHRMWMGFCVSMYTLLSVGGFAGWWSLSGVSYDADCDDDDYADDLADGNRWDMCAGHGATMSIVAVCAMAIAGILSLINSMLQVNMNAVKLSTGRVHCFGIKVHFVFCLVLLMCCIGLSIFSILIRKWVNFEDQSGDDQSGSLFAIDDTSFTYSGTSYDVDYYGWDCLAEGACDADDDSTICKTFEPLMDSGRFYLSLQVTVICLLLVWHPFLIYSIFFTRESGHPVLNHALPHLAWIVHLGATVMWATTSKVEFEVGDCTNDDVDSDERLDVCITIGPLLMIGQVFLMSTMAVYFSYVYSQRGESLGTIGADIVSTEGMATKRETVPTKPISDKYPTVNTYLTVHDGKSAMELYQHAFSGKLEDNIVENGKLEYAEIKIGDSYLMLADVDPEWKTTSPKALGDTTGEVLMVVPNCDELYNKCMGLGFTKQLKPMDMPWGDRYARVVCPYGHIFAFLQKTADSMPSDLKYRSVNTYLTVNDGKAALKAYEKVFDGELGEIMEENGKLEHGEMKIGDSVLIVADEDKEMNTKSPNTMKNTTMEIYLSIPNCDEQYKKCTSNKFKSLMKPAKMPWGDRYARVQDPWGHRWSLSTKLEEVSNKEMMAQKQRSAAGSSELPTP